MDGHDELQLLRKENARLKSLLTMNGIDWEEDSVTTPVTPLVIPTQTADQLQLTTNGKITLFRQLFRGRTDIYPLRWQSAKGSAGYSPACGNEWKPGICHKPKVKCGACSQRLLLPLTDQVIYDHLTGKHTIGVYPLLSDDSCLFLAADFDETDWRGDARAIMQSCHELDIPAALEISRSGNGGHIWIFLPNTSRLVRPGNSVPLSLATPAIVPGNCPWRVTTAFSPIRTPCPREVLAT